VIGVLKRGPARTRPARDAVDGAVPTMARISDMAIYCMVAAKGLARFVRQAELDEVNFG
jgi:hypothetical protein